MQWSGCSRPRCFRFSLPGRRLPARLLSSFLALLLCGVDEAESSPHSVRAFPLSPLSPLSRRPISPVRLPPPLLLSWCRCRAFPPRRPRSLWPRPPWVFLLKVTTSLFKNSAEKEKTLYPTLWAVISRRTF